MTKNSLFQCLSDDHYQRLGLNEVISYGYYIASYLHYFDNPYKTKTTNINYLLSTNIRQVTS